MQWSAKGKRTFGMLISLIGALALFGLISGIMATSLLGSITVGTIVGLLLLYNAYLLYQKEY